MGAGGNISNPGDLLTNAFNILSPIVGIKDGKADEGWLTRAVDEGVGQITGRNVARDAANKASDALDKADADQAAALKTEQIAKQNNDIQGSQAAAGAKATAKAASSSSFSGSLAARQAQLQVLSNSASGSTQKDFLGL